MIGVLRPSRQQSSWSRIAARSERTSALLRRRASSRAAVVVMFLWAFAEALVWPLIPDASLAILVAARPRRWLPLTIATVAGSVAGGAAGWFAASHGWTWPQPLTTPRMHAAVATWLADGAAGLAHQPLSGVPYKVFVAAAPPAGVDLGAFVLETLRYRGARLAGTALLTAAVAAAGWRWLPAQLRAAAHVATTGGVVALLVVGLALVVRAWS